MAAKARAGGLAGGGAWGGTAWAEWGERRRVRTRSAAGPLPPPPGLTHRVWPLPHLAEKKLVCQQVGVAEIKLDLPQDLGGELGLRQACRRRCRRGGSMCWGRGWRLPRLVRGDCLLRRDALGSFHRDAKLLNNYPAAPCVRLPLVCALLFSVQVSAGPLVFRQPGSRLACIIRAFGCNGGPSWQG